jgi:hypothetical protein
MKGFRKLLAIFAITLAVAGCETSNGVSGDYKFVLEGKPVFADGGTTISVRLARADGSPVAGAELYATRWVNIGQKNASRRLQRTAMHADGQGLFTYSSDDVHEGDTVHLEAKLMPEGSTVRGYVEVP